jgi:hypothetical protein
VIFSPHPAHDSFTANTHFWAPHAGHSGFSEYMNMPALYPQTQFRQEVSLDKTRISSRIRASKGGRMKCPACKSEDARQFRALVEGFGHTTVHFVDRDGSLRDMSVCGNCGIPFAQMPQPKKPETQPEKQVVLKPSVGEEPVQPQSDAVH